MASMAKVSHVAVLVVMTDTHYGRGSPPSGKRVRSSIEEARRMLDEYAPGAPVFSCLDEDYGWMAPLDAAALQRVYEKLALDPSDAMNIEVPSQHCNTFVDLEGEFKPTGAPVDRDLLFDDWYDNFGH